MSCSSVDWLERRGCADHFLKKTPLAEEADSDRIPQRDGERNGKQSWSFGPNASQEELTVKIGRRQLRHATCGRKHRVCMGYLDGGRWNCCARAAS